MLRFNSMSDVDWKKMTLQDILELEIERDEAVKILRCRGEVKREILAFAKKLGITADDLVAEVLGEKVISADAEEPAPAVRKLFARAKCVFKSIGLFNPVSVVRSVREVHRTHKVGEEEVFSKRQGYFLFVEALALMGVVWGLTAFGFWPWAWSVLVWLVPVAAEHTAGAAEAVPTSIGALPAGLRLMMVLAVCLIGAFVWRRSTPDSRVKFAYGLGVFAVAWAMFLATGKSDARNVSESDEVAKKTVEEKPAEQKATETSKKEEAKQTETLAPKAAPSEAAESSDMYFRIYVAEPKEAGWVAYVSHVNQTTSRKAMREDFLRIRATAKSRVELTGEEAKERERLLDHFGVILADDKLEAIEGYKDNLKDLLDLLNN